MNDDYFEEYDETFHESALGWHDRWPTEEDDQPSEEDALWWTFYL